MSMEITVSKAWLLDKVRANRDTHSTAFKDAVEGYRLHARELLERQMNDLLHGRARDIRIQLSRPKDHTRDYDRVIGMLNAHTEDTFTLPESDYAAYVDDDWEWKRQWALSNSGYASAGTRQYYTDYLEA